MSIKKTIERKRDCIEKKLNEKKIYKKIEKKLYKKKPYKERITQKRNYVKKRLYR